MQETNTESLGKKLASLFGAFFKIGAFTFGGGYAMIPIIEREAVEKHHWVTEDDILEIIAIAESTPGPIAVNSATFVGYRTAGLLGSVLATFGVVLPSFIIILVVSQLLAAFGSLKAVSYAFWGIRAAVIALLVKAVISMYQKSSKDVFSYCVIGAGFVLAAIVKIPVLAIIGGSAAAGLIYTLITAKNAKGGNQNA